MPCDDPDLHPGIPTALACVLLVAFTVAMFGVVYNAGYHEGHDIGFAKGRALSFKVLNEQMGRFRIARSDRQVAVPKVIPMPPECPPDHWADKFDKFIDFVAAHDTLVTVALLVVGATVIASIVLYRIVLR